MINKKDLFTLQTIINIAEEHQGIGGKPESYYDTVIKRAKEIIKELKELDLSNISMMG